MIDPLSFDTYYIRRGLELIFGDLLDYIFGPESPSEAFIMIESNVG